MMDKTHRRAGVVCIVLAVVLSIYSGRLIHLQVGKHWEYAELAAAKNFSTDQGRQIERRRLPGRDHQHPLDAGRRRLHRRAGLGRRG